MIKALLFILRYCRYLIIAKGRFKIHSPFVFELYNNITNKKVQNLKFDEIENIRKRLLKDNRKIKIAGFGAANYISDRKICDIARTSAKSAKNCKLLYNIIKYYKPLTMLELGASLGISTMYQSAAASDSRFVSIEGAESIAEITNKNLIDTKSNNVELLVADFDNVLSGVLNEFQSLDYLFVDGNHSKEPTIRYFEQCLNKVTDNSVFVFDDIHWSADMEEAWEFIKKHKAVSITLDLFFLGIVIFKKDIAKANYTLKY